MATQSQIRTITSYSSVLAGIFRRLTLAHAAWRQRRALEALDDAALHDLGLSRREALDEAQRPIWDVPQHWLK